MKNFKGFDDWIEIFRGGKQIDGSGREHDGDALIDRAVKTFNAAAHEPPLVTRTRGDEPVFYCGANKKVGSATIRPADRCLAGWPPLST